MSQAKKMFVEGMCEVAKITTICIKISTFEKRYFVFDQNFWLSSMNVFQGGGAKSIVMQISFVMLIFPLFSDQISGGAKVSEGGQTASGGGGRPPVEESQI